MHSKAVKRDLSEVEYKQHAWIDDDKRGAFVNGMTYFNRPYQVGDVICLDRHDAVVSETFDGFDFHTGEPVRCFNTLNRCYKCEALVESLWDHQWVCSKR